MPFEHLMKSRKTYSRRYPLVSSYSSYRRPWDEFILSEYNGKEENKWTNDQRPKGGGGGGKRESSSSSSPDSILHQDGFQSENLPPSTTTKESEDDVTTSDLHKGTATHSSDEVQAVEWDCVSLNAARSRSPISKRRPSTRKTMLPRFTCEGETTSPFSIPNLSKEIQTEFSFLTGCDENMIRRRVLDVCGQEAPASFEHFFSKTDLGTCKKIGEGTFGEVFSIRSGDRVVAVKVMPIEGKGQKSYADVLSELNVMRALSDLRNEIDQRCSTFVEVYGIHCIYGKYPKPMRDEWHKYNRENTSENDPTILNTKQLFIAMVTEYAGSDLEKIKIDELNRVRSIVWQLCLSMAVAERKLQFEHRDLHLGNVLVQHTSEDSLSFTLDGKEHVVTSHGIKASIVDYSLSRITIDGLIFYVNLESEEELFEGSGDAQYDVYRSMRQINGNSWRAFHPATNVDWLEFICSKLIDGNVWKNDDLLALKTLTDRICRCKSATDIVKSYFKEVEPGGRPKRKTMRKRNNY